MGGTHLRNLLSTRGVEVVGAADIDEGKLRRAAELGVKPYRDYRRLVEAVDAVVVATPPFLHREQAVYALERGVHVFLEKPMGVTLGDAEAIVRAAEKSGAALSVGYCLRFHRAYEWIAGRMERLGRPLLLSHASLGRMPSTPWLGDPEKSGGMLNENGVHVLYVMYWYAGPFSAVSAVYTSTPGRGIEDNLALSALHARGAVSSLAQSWSSSVDHRSWSMVFEDGAVVVDGYVSGRLRAVYGDGAVEELEFGDGEMYAREIRAFVDAVSRGEEPPVTGRDGLEVQRAVDAAYRSMREGRLVRL